MGQAKRKMNQRQAFLSSHPDCIYCGSRATTLDHCPPRVFFAARQSPESYEFPACEPCNASARLDEQALAVLTRSQLTMTRVDADRLEWEALVRGVKNNQPDVITEWMGLSRNEVKGGLRRAFGAEGDELRRQGWGLLNVGPLTRAMMTRFMLKLGKSLYYRHNQHIFDGVMYVYQIDCLSPDTTPKYFADILSKAPALSKIERNRKSLLDQFVYRFNHSPEHRVLYAVVQFNEQFVFQVIAISREMDAQLTASLPRDDTVMPDGLRHECFLSSGPGQHVSA